MSDRSSLRSMHYQIPKSRNSFQPFVYKNKCRVMAGLSRKFTSRFLLSTVCVFTALLIAPHFVQWSHATNAETTRIVFERPQPSDNNIFFFEGSCARNRTISRQDMEDTRLRLDVKQACAIESTARANPDMNIFLFSSCPVDVNSTFQSNRMAEEIFGQHKNVFVWHQSLESLFNKTDLEGFFHSNKMFDSPFKTQSSNVLRILLLKKFGGTYLDLDFIVRRSLSPLASNFAGFESPNYVNSAALRFGLDPVGRKVANMFMQELNTTFNGKIWGQNGPRMATRVMKKLCNFTKEGQKSGQDCEGFTIYNTSVFYPVTYGQWKHLYNEKLSEKILKRVENSTAVHLWNSMVRKEKSGKFPDLYRDSQQAMMVLQRKYCPISHSYNELSTKQ